VEEDRRRGPLGEEAERLREPESETAPVPPAQRATSAESEVMLTGEEGEERVTPELPRRERTVAAFTATSPTALSRSARPEPAARERATVGATRTFPPAVMALSMPLCSDE